MKQKQFKEESRRQSHPTSMTPSVNFDNHMHSGKLSNALQCLSNSNKSGVLNLNEKIGDKSVLDYLEEKHPAPEKNEKPLCHQSIRISNTCIPPLKKINAPSIRRAAMKTHDSHGPSGLDANEWRRILTTFK